jgi:hypothetical protein
VSPRRSGSREAYRASCGTGGRGGGRACGDSRASALVGEGCLQRRGRFGGREVDGEHEDVAFEEGDAIHAPGRIGELANELLFGWVFGFVFFEQVLGVAIESGRIFGGEHGGLAGASVGEGVER